MPQATSEEWRVVEAPATDSVVPNSGVAVDSGGSSSSDSMARVGRRRTDVYTLEEVAAHNHKDDAWIVVDDIVYDMTPHLRHHEGWSGSGKVSTLIALVFTYGLKSAD